MAAKASGNGGIENNGENNGMAMAKNGASDNEKKIMKAAKSVSYRMKTKAMARQ